MGVEGESFVPEELDGREVIEKKKKEGINDRFGRAYESSKYQWLPSGLAIDKDGKCRFSSYINNLGSRAEYEAVYEDLEALFDTALPYVENVVGYVDKVTFISEDEDDVYDHEDEFEGYNP